MQCFYHRLIRLIRSILCESITVNILTLVTSTFCTEQIFKRVRKTVSVKKASERCKRNSSLVVTKLFYPDAVHRGVPDSVNSVCFLSNMFERFHSKAKRISNKRRMNRQKNQQIEHTPRDVVKSKVGDEPEPVGGNFRRTGVACTLATRVNPRKFLPCVARGGGG